MANLWPHIEKGKQDMTRRSAGRNAGPKKNDMKQWLLLGGIALLILVLLGGILVFLTNNPPRSRLVATPTAVPAAKTTWEVLDPSLGNAVVSYGEYMGNEEPSSDNSCFGMYSKTLVCNLYSERRAPVTLSGMITFPQIPVGTGIQDVTTVVTTDNPEYFLKVPCRDGSQISIVSLDSIGPASARLRIIGQIPVGEWRYLDVPNVCGDGKITRFGWAFYPDEGPEQIIFHVWHPALILR